MTKAQWLKAHCAHVEQHEDHVKAIACIGWAKITRRALFCIAKAATEDAALRRLAEVNGWPLWSEEVAQ